jgi:predicted nucleic acid-binding protein
MILVDTSVWIGHLRHGNKELTKFLNTGQALTHRFVIGELALVNLQNRNTILSALQNLPQVTVASIEARCSRAGAKPEIPSHRAMGHYQTPSFLSVKKTVCEIVF